MQLPYLTGQCRERFDAWLDATLARTIPPLTFTELRKGVQALSWLYVERRNEGRLASRAIDGLGKRGALATYYAALHFLTVTHALAAGDADSWGPVRRVVDAGCGTGAVGAAIAAALPSHPRIVGVDRSGWALDEATRTWAAFDLDGAALRGDVTRDLPQLGGSDLLAAGWSISELEPAERAAVLRRVVQALQRGGAIFIAEPLSTRVSPWWDDWVAHLAPLGVRDALVRVTITRPRFIADMDKAARLDHQVIGARVLAGRTTRPQT